jgi:hypothetical protein
MGVLGHHGHDIQSYRVIQSTKFQKEKKTWTRKKKLHYGVSWFACWILDLPVEYLIYAVVFDFLDFQNRAMQYTFPSLRPIKPVQLVWTSAPLTLNINQQVWRCDETSRGGGQKVRIKVNCFMERNEKSAGAEDRGTTQGGGGVEKSAEAKNPRDESAGYTRRYFQRIKRAEKERRKRACPQMYRRVGHIT